MPKGTKEKGKKEKKEKEPVGTKALRGEEELIQGTKIFGPFPKDMQVVGKGQLIQIYDPNSEPGSVYWEYEDQENPETALVPANYNVWVVKAHVAFKPVASQSAP